MFKDIAQGLGEITGSIVGLSAGVIANTLQIPVWFVEKCLKSGCESYDEIREEWERFNEEL